MFKKSAILLLGLGSLAVRVSALNVTVDPGDLLLGFFQVNGTGTGVEANTYVLNLGAASQWRENTASPTVIGNIAADLENAFGSDWHENPNVRCAIVGVVGPTDSLTAGDPSRTVYFSQAAASFSPGATAPLSLSSNQRGTVSTQIKTFSGAANGRTAGDNPEGAIVGSSENSNFSNFLPPVQTTNFGLSASPLTSFGVGNIGSAGSYNVEAALDVYRILHSVTGADLTAGASPGSAAVGAGQYIGTFTIDSAGNVRLDIPAAPPASGYSSWADQNTLAGNDRSPTADPDGDGILNGIEFVTGGNPKATGDAARLPEAVRTPGFVDLVFRRTDASAYLNPGVETDDDLAGSWTAAVNGIAGVVITAENDFYGAGTDRVTVRIPVTGARNFARLKVTVPQ